MTYCFKCGVTLHVLNICHDCTFKSLKNIPPHRDPRIFGAAKVGCEAVPVKEVPYVFESNNPFWTERQQLGLRLQMFNKPPLGLTPSFVVQSRRISEIMRAIIQYEDAGERVPVEWCDELRELLGKGEVKS